MIKDTIRLSESTKRHLIKVKRITGTDHWNILCRWALCLSLRTNQTLTRPHEEELSNIEMTWRTLAGQNDSAYEAIVKLSYDEHKQSGDSLTINVFLRSHIQRGAAELLRIIKFKDIDALLRLTI